MFKINSNFLYLICVIVWTYFQYVTTLNVTVYTMNSHQGNGTTLEVNDCLRSLPVHLEDNISSVNTLGECVIFYEDKNCRGDNVKLYPGNPSHWRLSHYNMDNKISSISECGNCSYSKWRKNRLKIYVIRFTRRTAPLFLNRAQPVPFGCIPISPSINTSKASASVYPDGCAQLYSSGDCNPNLPSLQLKHSFLSEVAELGKWHWGHPVRSLSHCDYRCYASYSEEYLQSVELFPGTDFSGESYTMKLAQSCNALEYKLASDLLSINTHGNCIVLFETDDCSGPETGLVRLDNSNVDVHGNLTAVGVDWSFQIKSIKLCGQEIRDTKNEPQNNTGMEFSSDLDSDPVDDSGGFIGNAVIYVVVGLVIVLLLSLNTAFLIWKRRKLQNMLATTLSEKEVDGFFNGNNSTGVPATPENMPYNREYEITKDNFTYGQSTTTLGSGNYEVVLPGKLGKGLVRDVAIKMLKPCAPTENLRGLLREIKVLIHLGTHRQIVGLLGCCTSEIQNGTVFVILELCENGSLDKYLRSSKRRFTNLVQQDKMILCQSNDTSDIGTDFTKSDQCGEKLNTLQLIKWCLEIAEGMEYLNLKNVLHLDLATRNCLIDAALGIKIADFGLSKQLYDYTNYLKTSQAQLPWRWMALESLQRQEFSMKSDVWAFGVSLWEIFALGDLPYPTHVWGDEFISGLECGLRLPKPQFAPTQCYDWMRDCWREKPDDRKSFRELKEDIQRFWASNITISRYVDLPKEN